MRLVGCKVKYELIDGTVIEVVYRFHESSDKYIAGQKTVKVKSYKVYDINGNVLFEDSF